MDYKATFQAAHYTVHKDQENKYQIQIPYLDKTTSQYIFY